MKYDVNWNKPSDPGSIAGQLKYVAKRIERLAGAAEAAEAPVAGDGRSWTTEWRIRRIQKLRKKRDVIFGPNLFADPAWDTLLELYAASLSKKPISVSSLCIASGAPSTTALRWIRKLENEQWLTRTPDASDGRRSHVQLTQKAIAAMDRFFDEAVALVGKE